MAGMKRTLAALRRLLFGRPTFGRRRAAPMIGNIRFPALNRKG